MKEKIKLCIDCKWCSLKGNNYMCSYPDFLSLVNGEPTEYASYTRTSGKCGKEGVLWEEIPEPRQKFNPENKCGFPNPDAIGYVSTNNVQVNSPIDTSE